MKNSDPWQMTSYQIVGTQIVGKVAGKVPGRGKAKRAAKKKNKKTKETDGGLFILVTISGIH